MIDLHTHILPGMDDGAKTPEISLAMLQEQQRQGIDTVVLTPHCYRFREPLSRFLERREAAFDRLQRHLEAQPPQSLPRLLLGAEVAWVDNMDQWEELPRLCIGNTSNLLLELPFGHWSGSMLGQIYNLMDQRGVTPVIAHLERYLPDHPKEMIQEILSMGVPVQVSSSPMLHWMERGPVLRMIRSGDAAVMASDCHNMDRRPPTLQQGMEIVSRKCGVKRMQELDQNARRLVGL